MTTPSNIDPSTVQAYRETHYCVEGEPPITLVVGQRNASLAALQETAGVESSAFVTAWNPYSRKCDDDLNARRQKALADELAKVSLRVIEGDWEAPR